MTVTAPGGCKWTASATASWIHLPASSSGSGTATFTFTADANTGASRVGALLIAGTTVTFTQTAAAPPPSTTPSGITYDNIALPHTFVVGSPVPTANQTATYCCWPLPVRNAGSFTFNLSDFPANVLPSGGSSNVLSASEMLFVGINFVPSSTTVTMEWHKAVGQDTVVYSFSSAGPFAWAYSLIGHFSWEVSDPGSYYVLVMTPSGRARLDFSVTGSTPTNVRPTVRTMHGGGAGGAGW